jgi:hypothetical protein
MPQQPDDWPDLLGTSSGSEDVLWKNELSKLQNNLSNSGYRDALAQVASETSQVHFDSAFSDWYSQFFEQAKRVSFLQCLSAHYSKVKNDAKVQEMQLAIKEMENVK